MSDFANATGLPDAGKIEAPFVGDTVGNASREQIKAFVARIERLEEDKAAVMADMKEVYAEAKSMGFDSKILRKVVSLRKIDRRERQETDALTELYLGCVEG